MKRTIKIIKIVFFLAFVLGIACCTKVVITGYADPFSAAAMYAVNALWSLFVAFNLKYTDKNDGAK